MSGNIIDSGKPILATADKTPDYVITTIVILAIVLFWIFMLFLVLTSKPRSLPTTLLACSPGQCGTSIYNGEKRCGGSGEVINVNPSLEVCNSPFACDNPMTPFALLGDGSTSRDGNCPPNVRCRCLSKAQCAEYVASLFVTTNGNPYTSVQGTATSFSQQSGDSVSSGGIITVEDPTLSFCAVPLAWLNRTQPGCTGQSQMDAAGITACMASGFPCQQGTLAFIPTDPIAFDANPLPLINVTPLSCVRGKPCPSGQLAYWNSNLGAVDCAFAT